MRFDEIVALDYVSFEVCAGETRVVLGAAGSGKTTLLKAAIGLIRPDSGTDLSVRQGDHGPERERNCSIFAAASECFFRKADCSTRSPLRRTSLIRCSIGRSTTCSLEEVEPKVSEALRFVELEQTMEQFPSELSGGMRRRVGIARAVVSEPPLVLYDSPTAGLDPITANTIMALIAKERDSKNTANLIVTQRYQDGQLMANFRYNRSSGHLEPASGNGAGEQVPIRRALSLWS